MMLFLAWLAVPLVAFIFWALNLFATSYDLPGVHAAGIIALCLLTVSGGVLLGLAMRFVFKDPATPIFKSLLLIAPLLGFLFVLWDVDWIPVYLSSLSLPVCIIVFAQRRTPTKILAMLFALGTVVLLVVSETPTLRFQRYAQQFKTGCWCCGYRQRAMRELCSYQERGYDAIAKTITGDEGQIYNTWNEIHSDKCFEPLEVWLLKTHPSLAEK